VNPQAIMAAVPWIRRIWKVTPPNLRVPLLLVAAAVGVWQFVSGRQSAKSGSSGGAVGGPAADAGPPPLPSEA
jgi:hypothetical protein